MPTGPEDSSERPTVTKHDALPAPSTATLRSAEGGAGVPAPAAAPPGWPGVPGYEPLGALGEGGMGVVFRARHLGLKRDVALKVLKGVAGEARRRRFRAEAEAVARLQHPNIVQVFDVGEHDGQPYCAF